MILLGIPCTQETFENRSPFFSLQMILAPHSDRPVVVFSDDERRNVIGRLPPCPAGVTPFPWHSSLFGLVVDLDNRPARETLEFLDYYLREFVPVASCSYYEAVGDLKTGLMLSNSESVYANFA